MKTILTGIRPTGRLHLGHYLAVIKPILELQEDNIVKTIVMDLHDIAPKKEDFQEIRRFEKQLRGIGVDRVAIQSREASSEYWSLFWNFNKIATVGKLNRMTQYKDKKGNNPTLALQSYPVLMATDIAISNCEYVLIGQDQKQHLELAKDLIKKGNEVFGYAGIEPNPLILEDVSKIMSLTNPLKKMSKSDNDEKGCVYLDDEPSVITNKIKKAVTTPEGINNLEIIYRGCRGKEELDFSNAARTKEIISRQILEEIL